MWAEWRVGCLAGCWAARMAVRSAMRKVEPTAELKGRLTAVMKVALWGATMAGRTELLWVEWKDDHWAARLVELLDEPWAECWVWLMADCWVPTRAG